ncbi:MAG: proteasome component M29 [Bathelium mastoideum]|nr:MAG: proteasome component M29 [Bathelium mastoideum]
MASTQQSSEARELSLVGKVEFRFALADTDAKLQDLLHTYLAPLLLKLASEHRSVRDKVILVCQDINIRVQLPTVKLPVAALLKQFKEHSHKPLIRQFDLRYIQQGLARLSKSEQADLLPELLRGIAKDSLSSPAHGSHAFNLLLRVMSQYTLPPRASNEDQKLQLQLQISHADLDFLAQRFGDVILFNTSPTRSAPGLTTAQYTFLDPEERPGTWAQNSEGGLSITETKFMLCRWLASDLFTPDQRFLPALFASADANSRIADIGEDILRRTIPHINLEDETLIEKIYGLYFGGPVVSPVRAPLRIKLLSILSKSVLSTTFVEKVMQLVQDGLLTEQTGSSTKPGLETTKLRSAIFSYVSFLARRGSAESVQAVAPKLVYALKDFIETQGWPIAHPGEDFALRGLSYEIIGLLAKAGPPGLLQEENLELLRWLFRSLREDNSGSSTSVSLEETLSMIMTVFSGIQDQDVEDNLRQFLLEQMEGHEELDNAAARSGKPSFSRDTRYITVRFANRCLPYRDVVARWIDVAALKRGNQERHEIVEEAKKGLDPYWHLMNQSWTKQPGGKNQLHASSEVKFPDFSRTMSFFFFGVMDPEILRQAHKPPRTNGPAAALVQARSPAAYAAAIRFCRQILVVEAFAANGGPQIAIEPDWDRKIDLTIDTDIDARAAVSTGLRLDARFNIISKGAALALVNASLRGFQQFDGSSPGFAECRRQCGEIFVDMCSLSPNRLLSSVAPLALTLVQQTESNDPQTRALAAQGFGIMATHEDSDRSRVADMVHELERVYQSRTTAVGAQINKVHGALLALGYFFSRLSFRRGTAYKTNHFKEEQKIFFVDVLDIIQNSTDDTQLDGALTALDQLSLFHAVTSTNISAHISFADLAEMVSKKAVSGHEGAIACLGHLAITVKGDERPQIQEARLKYIQTLLNSLDQIKQAEIQFAVGEALSCLACGWDSKALITKIDVDAIPPPTPKRAYSPLSDIIDSTLADCRQTRPSLKKAGVIWLLCLIQYCGHRSELKERLPACQAAFKRCLSDRDTLVQESASRGLGLVYEQSDRQLKEDLVRDLVGSFSSDRAQTSGTVTEETELFEPGALPTGDGNSITTYRDIMNLATEVGDSSLIYRFMNLASNNSIWSTRAAFGRFGLSNILSDSSVDGYLAKNPKLYPKLYRYRFDPNTNVQRSMNDIWHAIVKNPTATIDEHFDAIMEDLLKSILAKEWRTREASCNAIADLIQGRPSEKYGKYLGDIWSLCFKVMDDIKDSVRVAAAGLARTLTGILTRSLESSGSAEKTAATLKDVLPFLLSTQGLESSAEDVRTFALSALLDIIKKANGPTLRPFIPDLIEKMLALLSTMEHDMINYVYLNAKRFNLETQQIDDMRLASVRNNPLMEAMERCLDLLDATTMKALIPKIESAMKSAIGVPTKVGCSRILVSLSTRCAFVFRPHADYFLKLVQKFVNDRNETVNLSYASSAGYLARSASEEAVIQLAVFSRQKLYFESKEDSHRLIAGEIVRAVAKYAPDQFKNLAAAFVPFVFLAKHDSTENIKNVFIDTWNERVGGVYTVSLYLKEIVELVDQYLDSPQWVLKYTASRTVADAIAAITGNIGHAMSTSEAERLWGPLRKALAGRTWEGKEVVLEAFAIFVEKGPEEFLSKAEVGEEIKKISIREAKRQNGAYRPYALAVLGQVASARKSLDLDVVDIIGPIIDQLTSHDENVMDIDSGKDAQNDKLRDLTLEKALLGLARGTNIEGKAVDSLLDLVGKAAGLEHRPTSISSAIFATVHKVLDRAVVEKVVLAPTALQRFADLLLGPLDEPERVRKERARAVGELSKVEMGAEMKGEIRRRISEEIGREISPLVKHDLEQARLRL